MADFDSASKNILFLLRHVDWNADEDRKGSEQDAYRETDKRYWHIVFLCRILIFKGIFNM